MRAIRRLSHFRAGAHAIRGVLFTLLLAAASACGPAALPRETPEAAGTPAGAGLMPTSSVPVAVTYVVQPGDTLAAIARRVYGDAAAWRSVYDLNKEVIGPDPDRLPLGVILKLAPIEGPVPSTTLAPPAQRQSTATPGAGSRPTTGVPSQAGTPTPVAQRLSGPQSVPVSSSYAPLPLQTDAALEASIRASLGDEVDHYALVVKRLSDGRGVALKADRSFYAASLFKLPVMYEVYKQRSLGLLSFDEPLTVTPPYEEYTLGPQRWPTWTEVPLHEVLEPMITVSDNVAAMLLYDRVGSWNIQRDMVALGLAHTDMASNDLPTSAGDMALLLELIARDQAVDATTSREMVALLSRQQVNDRLPLLLPPGTQVAHKTGNWDNVSHDVGIVYAPHGPYVLAVLSDDSAAAPTIAQLSRLVYDAFEGGTPRT